MNASVRIASDADLAAIAAAAGNANPDDRGYYQGALYVRGVEQSDLEAAAARPEFQTIAPPVPASVALWRARAPLAEAGLIEIVNTAVASLGPAAVQWWEYGSEVERNHPRIVQIAATLGLTEDQIDDLFRRAAEIEP